MDSSSALPIDLEMNNDILEDDSVDFIVDSEILGSNSSEVPPNIRKSIWWSHFHSHESLSNKIQCNYCKKIYSFQKGNGKNWGTGNMKRHMEREHKDKLSRSSKQTQLSFTDGSIGNFTFDLEKFHTGLVLWFISKEFPLSALEDAGLTELIRTKVQPAYKGFSRKKARNIVLNQFDIFQKKLISDFESLTCNFSLTCDSWTGINNEHYIVVTCSWIDDGWILQKKILAFRHWPLPHSGSSIYQVLINVCREYGISSRIFSVSLDNASANNNAISLLKSWCLPILDGIFFHARCVCHVMNLCVQDGLNCAETIIKPFREIVLHLRHSGARRDEFKRLCLEHNLPFRRFKLDCKTRWNSTYDMLAMLVIYKVPLIQFCENINGLSGVVDEYTFSLIDTLVNLLAVFYSCTKLLSGSHYPTSHLALQALVRISYTFGNFSRNAHFGDIIGEMEKKFLKYYHEIPQLFLVASILDPRIKEKGVQTLIELFGHCFVGQSNFTVNVSKMYQSAILNVQAMFDLYEKKFGGSNVIATTSVSSSSAFSINPLALVRSKHSSSIPSCHGEYILYNNTPIVEGNDDDSFDILTWWKSNSINFPILAKMAKDILTPPVSTVLSESAFSTSGRILTKKRSKLAPNTLEASICLKNWLGVADAKRQQKEYESSSEEEYEDST